MEDKKMEKIVSLAKRRGFVFQSSEIYGGSAGLYDLGPLGAEMMHNIKDLWWKRFVSGRDDIYGLSTSSLMPEKVWEASGHLKNFSDPMTECAKCKRRFRVDHIEDKKKCSECGGELGEQKMFSQMFPVSVGATEDGLNVSYLRGELAQGMFVNFKNVMNTIRPKIPFGIAQIGRAFRNEISPRDFLGRVREFELAEFEWFTLPDSADKDFDYWMGEMRAWMEDLGIDSSKVKEHDLSPEDRAHYSKKTIDFEYDSPFGDLEFQAIANRGDYDLNNHTKGSGEDFSVKPLEDSEKVVPFVIEPTFGMTRTFLAILLDAYIEDEMGGETRVYLKLDQKVAPVKAAVFPLMKNKPELVEKAREVYESLRKEVPQIMWDDNGNIGKRYRRQDEIGTPFCITVDFDTTEDDTVTVRDRDTGDQERVKISDLLNKIK